MTTRQTYATMKTFGLSDDEIRLLQGFRGLTPSTKHKLLTFVSGLVVERASEGRVLCRPFACEAEKSDASS